MGGIECEMFQYGEENKENLVEEGPWVQFDQQVICMAQMCGCTTTT